MNPQRPSPASGRTLAREIQAFQRTLGITDAQRARQKAIDDKYQTRLEAIGRKHQKDRDAYAASKHTAADLAKLQASLKALQAELKPVEARYLAEREAVFTPAQRAKIKAFTLLMQQRRAPGR